MPKAKSKAWKAFSLYIRTRDSINGMCQCVTCGKVAPIKDMHAGHFLGGRSGSILFDEEMVFAQCLTKESNLRLFNGRYKSIKDVVIGEKLWAFDESNFELKTSVVEDVSSFIPNELYEVCLENGNKFYATGDHLVVSNGKWTRIDEMLHNVGVCNIMEL